MHNYLYYKIMALFLVASQYFYITLSHYMFLLIEQRILIEISSIRNLKHMKKIAVKSLTASMYSLVNSLNTW